jgi:hypothetical protein
VKIDIHSQSQSSNQTKKEVGATPTQHLQTNMRRVGSAPLQRLSNQTHGQFATEGWACSGGRVRRLESAGQARHVSEPAWRRAVDLRSQEGGITARHRTPRRRSMPVVRGDLLLVMRARGVRERVYHWSKARCLLRNKLSAVRAADGGRRRAIAYKPGRIASA